MRDMDLFRAAVRDVNEEDRRARGSSRATWCLVVLGAVTATMAVATFVVLLLTYLAR